MKPLLVCALLAFYASTSFGQSEKEDPKIMKTETRTVACKLSTPELQERKKTVIAELKKLLLERVEMANGVKYKFESTDELIDKVTLFIKTERLCCDFFDFDLSLSAETGFMWLALSGPAGTKEFIEEEIGF